MTGTILGYTSYTYAPNTYRVMAAILSIGEIPVTRVMTTDVKTIADRESLQQACKIMRANNIGSVVIVSSNGVQDKIPVGIITERDVIYQIVTDPSIVVNSRVKEIMSKPLITVSPNTSLRDALRIIVSKSIRRLPVLENGILVGILTDKDIYRVIVRDESLLAGLLSDEIIMKHIERLEQPFVYKLGEILHRRLVDEDSRDRLKDNK
jgi:CBS domain-containing protein